MNIDGYIKRQLEDLCEAMRKHDCADGARRIEYIFPELRDSEDERIRKGIVQTIKQCPDTFLNPKNRDEMIDYLEKQKEQKPVEYLNKDKVYAIMTKLTNLSYSQLIPINSDEFKKLHEITSEVRDLLDYPIEQKPAEGKYYSSPDCGTTAGVWSEEDEKCLQEMIRHIEHCVQIYGASEPKWQQWLNFLKSLRPQPKQEWKPSEEQMNNLNFGIHALEQEGYDETASEIKELYEQLKKLMEE